jgi:putative membrane protein (TIGR04086 family)
MRNETSYGNGFFSILKGVGIALVLSLTAVAILACLPLPQKLVYPINQTVKVIAVSLGALLFVRGEKGWLKGIAIGLIFTALSYLAFSAIGGDFSLSWLIFVELLLAALSGALSGAIAVNMKR